MKKIIAIMVMTVMTLGVFASHWSEADKTHLSAAIADEKTPTWYKVHCIVHLAYLTDSSRFDTFEKLVDECRKANLACGLDLPIKDVEEVGRIVLGLQDYFKQYNEQTFEYIANNHVALYWYTNGVMENMAAKERWFGIMNCLIDYNHYAKSEVAFAVNRAFTLDSRVQKADKVELYTLLYEKLYTSIADESNLTADQKVYTKIATKLAMKLKALGVEVK